MMGRALTLYQVDAFASEVLRGNPAAVCPSEDWLPDRVLQGIAEESNLSETAIFVPKDDGFHIRWFTPKSEVNLCEHATVASAFILFEKLDWRQEVVTFESDLPPRTSPPSNLDPGALEVHSTEQNRVLVTWGVSA